MVDAVQVMSEREEEKAELPLVTNSLIDDNNTQFASPLLEAWSLITPSRCFYSRLPLLLCPSLPIRVRL